MDLSAILNKPALCRQGCKNVGVVVGGIFCLETSRLKFFKTDGFEKYLLPLNCVCAIDDAVIFDSDESLIPSDGKDAQNFADCDGRRLVELWGKDAFTATGAFVGKIDGAHFNKAGKLTKLAAGEKEFLPSAIEEAGDFVLLKSGAIKRFSTVKTATAKSPSALKPPVDYKVKILDEQPLPPREIDIIKEYGENEQTNAAFDEGETPNEETDDTPAKATENKAGEATNDTSNKAGVEERISILPIEIFAPKRAISAGDGPAFSETAFAKLLDGDSATFAEEDAHTPTRIICDYDFLLGRELAKDIFTYNGELIAAKGSAVDKSVVEKARWAGKLVELTLNSIKKDSSRDNRPS